MPQVVVASEQYDWRRDRTLAACAVAAVLLVIAAVGEEQASGFYRFVHICASSAAVFLAVNGWKDGRVWLPLMAALIAILFNPIRPIELDQTTWQAFDFIAAAWFVCVGAWPSLKAAIRASRNGRSREALSDWAVTAIMFLIIAVPLVVAVGSTHAADDTMNVDENLTTTDMGAASDVNDAANQAASDAENAAAAAADQSNASETPDDTSPALQPSVSSATPEDNTASANASDSNDVAAPGADMNSSVEE